MMVEVPHAVLLVLFAPCRGGTAALCPRIRVRGCPPTCLPAPDVALHGILALASTGARGTQLVQNTRGLCITGHLSLNLLALSVVLCRQGAHACMCVCVCVCARVRVGSCAHTFKLARLSNAHTSHTLLHNNQKQTRSVPTSHPYDGTHTHTHTHIHTHTHTQLSMRRPTLPPSFWTPHPHLAGSLAHLCARQPRAPHDLGPVAQELLDELELLEPQGQHELVLNCARVCGRRQCGQHLHARKADGCELRRGVRAETTA